MSGIRLGLVCVLSAAALFGIDALLFRTNLYPSIIHPDSAAGQFELTLFREREFLKRHPEDNVVATLGDSRFAYSPKLANEKTAETGLVFRQAGLAGTEARTWYYMMRDLDPTAQRYRAILIGVPDFDDVDDAINPFGDGRSIHYLAVRLRLADTIGFARSFDEWRLRWLAFRGGLWKGFLMQRDIQDFFEHPQKRIDYVRQCHRGYESWTYDFEETERSMAGVQIDWKTGEAKLPPDATQDQRETVAAVLLRRSEPQRGRTAAFRREWLGRIVERYRGSRTKVIFVRLPRGPVPPPDNLVPIHSAVIREFSQRQSNVMLCPEHAFDSLEHPELFKDGLHLNRAGIAQFSPMLAQEIAGLMAPGKAARN